MKKLGKDLSTKKNNQNKDIFIEINDELPMPKIKENLFGLTNKSKKEEKENEITWYNIDGRKEKEE